jgi:hypothetical protein
MLNRKERRAAEHQARKRARKAQRAGLGAASQDQTSSPLGEVYSTPRPSCAVSLDARLQDQTIPAAEPIEQPISQAQVDANRANSQLSSGPKTEAGKAISSQNRRYHGLAGEFIVMPWEDADVFVTLRDDLRTHYSPADLVEQGYVDRLAEHTWLRQRCLHLQAFCFELEDDARLIDDEKQFALLARYQKENENRIDKCVNMLLKLRAVRQKEENGFESEIRKEAAETRKNEAHQARLCLSNARAKSIEIDSEIRQTVEAPIPGHLRIPFNKLSACFRGAIRQVTEEIKEEQAAA